MKQRSRSKLAEALTKVQLRLRSGDAPSGRKRSARLGCVSISWTTLAFWTSISPLVVDCTSLGNVYWDVM